MSLLKHLLTEISKGKEKFIVKNTLNRLGKFDIQGIRDKNRDTFYSNTMNFSDYDEFFEHVKRIVRDDFMGAIRKADPTSEVNGEYSVWLSKIFTQRPYLQEFILESGGVNVLNVHRAFEDIGKIKKYLKTFHYLKDRNMTSNNDINSYKTVEDLFEEVRDHLESDLLTNKEQVMEQTEIIYEDKDLKILVPETYESSCYWGTGTNWCTAVDDGDESTFNSYKSRGDLYIIIYGDEKFQMHIDNYYIQFMNKNDHEALDEYYDIFKNDDRFYHTFFICWYHKYKNTDPNILLLQSINRILEYNDTFYWKDYFHAVDKKVWEALYKDTENFIKYLVNTDNISRYVGEINSVIQYMKNNDGVTEEISEFVIYFDFIDFILNNGFEDRFKNTTREFDKFLDGLMK